MPGKIAELKSEELADIILGFEAQRCAIRSELACISTTARLWSEWSTWHAATDRSNGKWALALIVKGPPEKTGIRRSKVFSSVPEFVPELCSILHNARSGPL